MVLAVSHDVPAKRLGIPLLRMIIQPHHLEVRFGIAVHGVA